MFLYGWLRNTTKSWTAPERCTDRSAYIAEDARGRRTSRQLRRGLTPYPLLLATTVVGVVLPTAACSRQAPVRSIGNAETAPALTPCRDTKPEHHLLCGHLSVP